MYSVKIRPEFFLKLAIISIMWHYKMWCEVKPSTENHNHIIEKARERDYISLYYTFKTFASHLKASFDIDFGYYM